MSSDIKVSVIIPVYQVENYLERAVDSVLAQTLEEKEIILVDDGSQDGSPEICDRYAGEYPGLIQVIHKENEGLGMARNTGVRASRGEYVAFLDSDDTVEPEMYEEMYRKAEEEHYDIVMCDVRIIYVEEDRSTVVTSYPQGELDLSDYIANGNNITYSVNKLYRRKIWEENQYEKMLFEDISLIPALVTKYQHIGYVRKPFYNYYRRANTISTTFVGDMVDIIQAFRNYIDTSNPNYREEVIYCAAKQIYWNMTKSRVLFQADFIELLKEYKKDFILNPYISKDKKINGILAFLEKEVIPENFICACFHREPPEGYLDAVRENFPKSQLFHVDENYYLPSQLPESVLRALSQGKNSYAEEYYALRVLFEEGGIVLSPHMRTNLNLKRLRLNHVFFGFEDDERMTAGCYGAQKGNYVIQALLDTFQRNNIYNKALLSMEERLRDFLIVQFGLKPNGRKQILKNEIQIYLPSVLVYDMKDGENCCKKELTPILEGYELVSDRMLKLWSDRMLENWNLYKQELNIKRTPDTKTKPVENIRNFHGVTEQELERQLQEAIDNYENSTSWKLTRPIRYLGRLWKKWRNKR